MVTHGGPLIGRESELAELQSKLASSPLVTITGAGGCGKTRLALETAERIASPPDREDMWWLRWRTCREPISSSRR